MRKIPGGSICVLRSKSLIQHFIYINPNPLNSSWTRGIISPSYTAPLLSYFIYISPLTYTYFYNHAHRLRFEKLLYLELPKSPNGFFLVLLVPGGGFRSETAVM